MERLELIKQRSCGACSVCCVVLPVDTPEIRKAPGLACLHCVPGGGCGIHATRPQVCRIYHCAWRYLDWLDETWRPDLSGVLLEFHDEDIPQAYAGRSGVRLTITARLETMFTRGFVNLVMRLVQMKVPAFLCIRGPVGHYPANTFLNDALQSAVDAGDQRRVARQLAEMLNSLAGFTYRPFKPANEAAPDFAVTPAEWSRD